MSEIRILIVDDEADALKEFYDNLHEYDVTIETKPQKALELLETQFFPIIITDCQMPFIL